MQFTSISDYISVPAEESTKFFKWHFRSIFIGWFSVLFISCQKDENIHQLVGNWNYASVDHSGSVQIEMTITKDYLGSWHVISSPTCFENGAYVAATPSYSCYGNIYFSEEYFTDETFSFDLRAKDDFFTLYFNDWVNEYAYKINGNLLVLEIIIENTLYGDFYSRPMVFRKE